MTGTLGRPATTPEIAMDAERLTARLAAGLVRAYQLCLSGLKPACCRFQPSCSEYARQALLSCGLLAGTWLTVRRLLRCHPFYRGPVYDPVPPSPRPPRAGFGEPGKTLSS